MSTTPLFEQQSEKQIASDVCRVERRFSVRTQRMEDLLRWLEGRGESHEKLAELASIIGGDPFLEDFLFQLSKEDFDAIRSADQLQQSVEFYREHPDWWSQNIEASFEKLNEEARKYTKPGLDRLFFDLETGVSKAVYKTAKGAVTGLWSLVSDIETWKAALEMGMNVSSLYFRLRYGTHNQKVQALGEIHEGYEKVSEMVETKVKSDWAKAEREGKQAELIAEWISRGILEAALFYVSLSKAPAAVGTLSKGMQGAGLTKRAMDFGLKLTRNMKYLGIEMDGTYMVLRMQRFDLYAERIRGIKGVKGVMKGFRAVPKETTFPFYDAHPRSIASTKMRWHLPGEKAVYFSESKLGVEAEMLRYDKLWKSTQKIESIELRYRNALDLTDPKVLRRLRIDPKVLYGSDNSHAQVIGSLARSLGYDAIIANSAAAEGRVKNLILLRKELTP